MITLPKNAKDPNQHPQNATTIAISIAATTFVVHPLYSRSNGALYQTKFLPQFNSTPVQGGVFHPPPYKNLVRDKFDTIFWHRIGWGTKIS